MSTIAFAASASLIRTIRAQPAMTLSTASGSGTRQATPSTNVSADSVDTTWPASYDRAYAGAFSATTPTISQSSPSRSRTAMFADTPLPSLDFTGATCITQTTAVIAPTTYSIEVWFRTSTKANGKLIGFGDNPTTPSSEWKNDRHLYIDSTGRLIFGTYMRTDDTQHNIVTSKSYADGGWHHAIATSTAAGALAFYVDGAIVGTTTISNQDTTFSGYWKVGCGNLNTWQNGTGTWLSGWPNYYTGQLRFAAVYTTTLTAAQSLQHYQAGI